MFSKDNLKLVAVAAFCLAVGLAGPSVAGAVQQGLNADQVDGKHAVGAKAKIAKRKNKLVATNKQGYLPSNIIQGTTALRSVWIPTQAIGTTEPKDFYGAFLPDAQLDSINVMAQLPPSYRSGAPVTLDLTYVKGPSACTVSLGTLGDHISPSTSSAGSLIWNLPVNAFAGDVALPGTTGNLRLRLVSVENAPLHAGDYVGVRVQRNGNSVTDVCAQSVYVYGAQLRF